VTLEGAARCDRARCLSALSRRSERVHHMPLAPCRDRAGGHGVLQLCRGPLRLTVGGVLANPVLPKPATISAIGTPSSVQDARAPRTTPAHDHRRELPDQVHLLQPRHPLRGALRPAVFEYRGPCSSRLAFGHCGQRRGPAPVLISSSRKFGRVGMGGRHHGQLAFRTRGVRRRAAWHLAAASSPACSVTWLRRGELTSSVALVTEIFRRHAPPLPSAA